MNREDVRDHKAENTPDNTVWCITIIHWHSDTIRSSALKRRQNIHPEGLCLYQIL